MMQNSVAVIMAGGKSSRMQRDKALLPFGGESTLIEFQYRRLEKIFAKVYVAAKSNKFGFKVNLIEDRYATSSPLVALISMFESLEVDEVFVLSVDAPFVSQEVIAKLYASRSEEADIIVAESNHGLEPLCAIYRRSFLECAYGALEADNHRLQSLFDTLSVVRVKMEEEAFLNLNYPAEYEEAKLKWGEKRG